MNILPHGRRYEALSARVKDYGFGSFTQGIKHILQTNQNRMADINQGRKNFQPNEIFSICHALDIEPTAVNLIRFFPPMGVTVPGEAKREEIREVLIELLEGKTA